MTAVATASTVYGLLKGLNFSAFVESHCAAIWSAWKGGKTECLNDPEDPFQGGPQTLLDKGITELDGVNGLIVIGPLTRIRMRDLTDFSLEQLGIKHLKDKAKPGADVIHPEYVADFATNIANSKNHFLNNAVTATAVCDAIFGFVTTKWTTVAELIEIIEETLAGNRPDVAKTLTLAARGAWLGRVLMDGSYAASKDFTFYPNLQQSASHLDVYVTTPVLQGTLEQLKSGQLESASS